MILNLEILLKVLQDKQRDLVRLQQENLVDQVILLVKRILLEELVIDKKSGH